MNKQFEIQLRQLLAQCHSYSLSDLGGATLMNRVDTKFVVHAELVPRMIQALRSNFKVLDINGERCFEYDNTYYDTNDYQFYSKHHQGKLNRHKVRVRKYVNSDTLFLEVKHKNNKKRTDKKRIPVTEDYDTSLTRYRSFLAEAGISPNLELQPSITCCYTRIALSCQHQQDRLTIDFNVTTDLLNNPNTEESSLGGIAIVELKQAKIDRSSPVFDFMREQGIRPASISKYCMGFSQAAKVTPTVKFNRFKKIATRVEKIQNTTGWMQ